MIVMLFPLIASSALMIISAILLDRAPIVVPFRKDDRK